MNMPLNRRKLRAEAEKAEVDSVAALRSLWEEGSIERRLDQREARSAFEKVAARLESSPVHVDDFDIDYVDDGPATDKER